MKKAEIKALTLKNYQLKTILNILDVPLHSERARARNRFYKIISAKENERETERIKIAEKYGKLNKERMVYEFKQPEKFSKEFSKLQNEVSIIDILPSVKADLPIIKEIINNSKIVMNFTETEVYEEIIAEFAKI
jgi:uncharacterized Fe-S cluster-containing protein